MGAQRWWSLTNGLLYASVINQRHVSINYKSQSTRSGGRGDVAAQVVLYYGRRKNPVLTREFACICFNMYLFQYVPGGTLGGWGGGGSSKTPPFTFILGVGVGGGGEVKSI
jgi:hypothetical protein